MSFTRILLPLVLLTSTLPASAQVPGSPEWWKREPGDKPAQASRPQVFSDSIAKQIPVKRKFDHKIKIETTYDKFQNRTDVQLMHTDVFRRGYKIRMTALLSYPGTTASMPTAVMLGFNSTAPEWQYLRERDITILADGERHGPVRMELLDTRINRGSVTETLVINIGLLRFLRIINSSTVEIQLGDAEFSLEYKHLEALRDLASRMQP